MYVSTDLLRRYDDHSHTRDVRLPNPDVQATERYLKFVAQGLRADLPCISLQPPNLAANPKLSCAYTCHGTKGTTYTMAK